MPQSAIGCFLLSAWNISFFGILTNEFRLHDGDSNLVIHDGIALVQRQSKSYSVTGKATNLPLLFWGQELVHLWELNVVERTTVGKQYSQRYYRFNANKHSYLSSSLVCESLTFAGKHFCAMDGSNCAQHIHYPKPVIWCVQCWCYYKHI
jgi:hypothetical protein